MANVKVKMIQGTFFESQLYEQGKTYKMSKEAARAIGSIAQIIEKLKDSSDEDENKKDKKDKNVTDADNKMITGNDPKTQTK